MSTLRIHPAQLKRTHNGNAVLIDGEWLPVFARADGTPFVFRDVSRASDAVDLVIVDDGEPRYLLAMFYRQSPITPHVHIGPFAECEALMTRAAVIAYSIMPA